LARKFLRFDRLGDYGADGFLGRFSYGRWFGFRVIPDKLPDFPV
jgi:hypothetical protein